MPLFVVDRVMPGLTAELLVEAQRCLQEAVRRVSDGGDAVRSLRCTFIPDQQRCLDLFEAASAAEVRRINDIRPGAAPLDRPGTRGERTSAAIGRAADAPTRR